MGQRGIEEEKREGEREREKGTRNVCGLSFFVVMNGLR